MIFIYSIQFPTNLSSQNIISSYITSISALTYSPSLGTKIFHIYYITGIFYSVPYLDMVYILSLLQCLSAECDLGGLHSMQRQRQDTNGFSSKLHLLILELFNID